MRQKVRCILVNYRSPWGMLQRCLDSLQPQTSEEASTGPAVTLVDNASGDGVLDEVRRHFPAVRIVELEANMGFAAAVNLGLETAMEPFVLLLNTDAVLAPGALELMTAALQSAPEDVAGIAPKMMSSAHAGIIDAVGTVTPRNGAPFNRGIGQCDLGQYDSADEVAGVCFGAALLKRELFSPGKVGPLYEGYFLYFEDSDWCMRAMSMGYRFLTEPAAVVYHVHSGVTRLESLPFKYRLIELNTLKMVVRNFESPLRVAEIVASRCARLVARTLIRRRFIRANLSTLAAFSLALPRLLGERRRLKARRTASDRAVFALAADEDAFFDTVGYLPHRQLESLAATYRRLLAQTGDPEHGKKLAALYRLQQQPPGTVPTRETERLFAGQPDCVRKLLADCCRQAAD